MDTLDAIPAFLAILDEGTIQGAATRLGISRPTVRKRLRELEATVGAPLVFRGESGLEATESGRVYAIRARQMLQDLDVLARSARAVGPAAGGVLRIGMPTGTPPPILANLVAVLSATWPALALELVTSALRRGELLRNVDCMFCLDIDAPAGPFEVVDLGIVREQLVASPEYLEANPPICTLDDLADHVLLGWIAPDTGRPTRLPVRDGVAPTVEFDLCCDDPTTLIWMAARGQGLAWVPFERALAGPPFVDAGPLVPVLPEVVGRDRKRTLVVANAMAQVPTMRAFMEVTRQAARQMDEL